MTPRIDITTGRPYRRAVEDCFDHSFSEIGICNTCGYSVRENLFE